MKRNQMIDKDKYVISNDDSPWRSLPAWTGLPAATILEKGENDENH